VLEDVPRRSFLRVVAVTTTSVLLGTALPASARGAPARRGTTAPSSPDGVVRLGRAYLREHPKERELDTLRGFLPQLDPAQPARGQFPVLAPAVADDFAAGRSVVVDGWLLGATEARAAAAVALGA
jgi:hypothetical protein